MTAAGDTGTGLTNLSKDGILKLKEHWIHKQWCHPFGLRRKSFGIDSQAMSKKCSSFSTPMLS